MEKEIKSLTCIDCGAVYPYDPNRPLGASNDRCPNCRKRQSRLNKKIQLLQIAGNGVMQCRKCGYARHPGALTLVDGVATLNQKSKPQEHAKKQFILCENCLAELKHGEFKFRVLSASYPFDVQFYTSHVITVVKEYPLEAAVSYSSDAIDMEITSEAPDLKPANKTKLLQ